MEPAPKPRPHQSSALADNEADANSDYNDDFEKDEVVRMEAVKPKHKPVYAERLTKESSRDAGSDNHSLMREISVRNRLETVIASSSVPPSNRAPPSKAVGLKQDSSVKQLVASPSKKHDIVHPVEAIGSLKAKLYQQYNNPQGILSG